MATKIEQRTYEDAVAWLREHGFDLIEAPGTQARVFLKKYNVSAAIQKTDDGGVKIFAYPGYLVGGEISKLINRGYQQFLKTTKTEVPATADHLKALHDFAEEMKKRSRCRVCITNRSARSASHIITIALKIVTRRKLRAQSVPWEMRKQLRRRQIKSAGIIRRQKVAR